MANSFLAADASSKRCKQLREQVTADSKFDPGLLFRLLLNTAQYEFTLKEVRWRM